MTVCFLVWCSVCLIDALAWATGVVFGAVAAAVGCRTNQPYCFESTALTFFVGSVNAALSNSGTVWPFVNVALPHVFLLDGSCGYFFPGVHQTASDAPVSCFWSVCASEFALAFLPRRM